MAKIKFFVFFICLMGISQAYADEAALRIPIHASFVELDTSQLQDIASLWVSRQIDCQLIRMKSGIPTLEAAESIHYLSPLLIDIKLKQNIYFSNGKELTADDVIATFDYLKNKSPLQRNFFNWVDSITLKNKYEVIIKLKQPVPQLLSVLGEPFYAIFEKNFLLEAYKNPSLWDMPVGCGGYKIIENNDKVVKLEPTGHEGLPIDFYLIPDSQIYAKDVDKFDIISLEVIGTSEALKKFNVVNVFDPFQYYFALNTRIWPWNNLTARCTFFSKLSPSIPMKAYKDEVTAADDLIPAGTLGYVSHENYMQNIIDKFKNYNLPNKKSTCVSFIGTSIEKDYRQTYLDMIRKIFTNATSKIISNCNNVNEELEKQKCDGTFFAVKSNTLDAYEFIEFLSEKGPNATGYYNSDLAKEIAESQNIQQPAERAAAYQSIIDKIKNLCIIYPLFTMPYDKIYVRNNLMTPEIGTNSLNDFYLGNIKLKN